MSSLFNFKNNADKNLNTELPTDKYLETILFLALRLMFLLVIITTNFTALSIALNCNKNATSTTKFMSGIFAFFFGFIYIVVNFYTYRVLSMKKICEFDKERLFPF